MPDHVRAIFGSFQVSFIVSTTATLLELAKFCSMDTLELCGDILLPGGQLETPGLVLLTVSVQPGIFKRQKPIFEGY